MKKYQFSKRHQDEKIQSLRYLFPTATSVSDEISENPCADGRQKDLKKNRMNNPLAPPDAEIRYPPQHNLSLLVCSLIFEITLF